MDYNFSRGTDLPVWVWMQACPTLNYHGCSNAYDGSRYIYWVIQYGSSSATASSTQLWKFCTWSNAWTLIGSTANSGYGLDVEFDAQRNVIYISNGAATTSWQVFNLNSTSVQICGVTCATNAFTTMTPVLPAAGSYGASLTQPSDLAIVAQIETGIATTGSTSTVLYDTNLDSIFGQGMVGLQVRYTSGTLSGQHEIIASVQNMNQLTTAAFTGAPTAGDTYVIEVPQNLVATAGATTTITATGEAFPVNLYSNSDVVITSGTGSGQRKRIASNTATVLTLAAAQTGNTRTGPFSVAPNATSVFQIVPSSDFLYYQPGATSAVLYRIDLNTGATAVAWSTLASATGTPGGGANTFFPASYAPFSIVAFRGNATVPTIYQYSIGLNTWQTIAIRGTLDTFTTGSSAAMLHGRRRLFVQKEGTTRTQVLNLATGDTEGFPNPPYAVPGVYDGKRGRFVKTADGVEHFYLLRAGGQEFFRVAVEWMG